MSCKARIDYSDDVHHLMVRRVEVQESLRRDISNSMNSKILHSYGCHRYFPPGNGQRCRKQSSVSGTTTYFGGLYEVRNGVGTIHIFAGGQRVASVLADGKTQFYHANHLGSSSFITDQTGAPKEQIEYLPFGEYRAPGQANGTIDYDANFPDVFYTFTGQEDDDDLGLYNYGARLYDPLLGRFISPDRLVPEPGNPQALNRYAYCLNNPLIYTDPSGEIFGIDDTLFWLLLGYSVLYGALSGAATARLSGGNWVTGALIGGVTGGIATVASLGITNLLFPSVYSATANISWTTRVAAAAVGGFTAGAVNGAGGAAASGGIVWQAALYGGLMSAAYAGLVQGAIELNGANSSGSTLSQQSSQQSNQDMSNMVAGQAVPDQRIANTWDSVTNEKILELDPAIQRKVTSFINNAERYYEIKLRIFSAYRTVAEQDSLFKQGISPVPGGKSAHNFALAFDVVEMVSGQPNWNSPNWDIIGRLGSEAYGFTWGGSWTTPDRVHFELPGWQYWK